MNAVATFGFFSALLMVFAGIRVLLLDRRGCDRIVVVCSLIAQAAIIALHSTMTPENTVISMMAIEGALLYFILKTDYAFKASYSALVFASITLSFLWGIDYTLNTGLFYVDDEPSIYTIMTAILTIGQAAIFLRTATHGRSDNHFDLYHHRHSINKSDTKKWSR